MTDTLNATIDMRSGEALDDGQIDAAMRAHIEGLEGAPEIRQFPGGQSNLTYSIAYGARRFVLRRPPFGTKPKSGHSMIREYRVMNSLKAAYPTVPDTLFYMDDAESPFGAEFYVMAHVDGLKVGRDFPADITISEADARALGFQFIDKLIDLHAVDYQSIGLGDFGRPAGYVKRQVEGWIGRWGKAVTDDIEDFTDVTDWLAANMPATEVGHCVVHGDYRLDNLILDPATFEIKAIIDWEISALGDPLMDLGNTLAYWQQEDDPDDIKMLRMQPSNASGMPSRDEFVAYYGEKTGIDVSGFDYYLAFGVFRLAVILQQIYYRYYHGQTQNEHFARFGPQVNILGRHARRLIGASKS